MIMGLRLLNLNIYFSKFRTALSDGVNRRLFWETRVFSIINKTNKKETTEMKRIFVFAIAALCVVQLFAAEKSIKMTYTVDGDVATNFTAQVQEGWDFFSEFPLPEGRMPNLVMIEGKCEQERHTNCCLTVGLNKYDRTYTQSKELRGAVNDAKMMAEALKKGGVYNKVFTLTDEEGTLENIRDFIRDCAENLVEGDSFLYFHSSHGDKDPEYLLCTYNADYTAEDLAYDLSFFKDGVKVVIILDACHSGGMFEEGNSAEGFANAVLSKLSEIKAKNAPPGADIKVSDCLFLCAARKDQMSNDMGEYSAFTLGILNYCGSSAADADKDGLISFREVYEKACEFTKFIKKKGQDPVISNPMLAEDWYFGHVKDHDGAYALSLYPDDNSMSFYLAKVTQDFEVDVRIDDKNNTFDLKAFKAKVDLSNSKGKRSAAYSTRISATLVFPFAIEDFSSIKELPASLILFDRIIIGSGVAYDEPKKKLTLQDLSNGNAVVKSILSVNTKKRETTLKIKYEYYTDLYDRMEPGTYDIPLSSRIRGINYYKNINVTVTEKSGKSLTVKMNKKK